MNIRYLSATFVLFLLILMPIWQAWAYEKPPLFLKLGEQRVLRFEQLDRYSVSGSAIRYTRLGNENQLLIKGIAVGMSTLLVKQNSETHTQAIRVEAKVESTYPPALYQALNQLESVETIDGGSQFILRGKISRLKDAQAINHLKKQFSKWVIDETTLDAEWLKQNTQEIAAILKPYPHLKLIASEGELMIQGTLNQDFQLQALTKKISVIQPLTQIDIQTIKGFTPTLYFKVFLLEVKKEFSSRLGNEIAQPVTGVFNNMAPPSLTYSINALTAKGMVRILSAPELVVKSPGQAELFAGGEMPIRLISRTENKVVWKSIGLSLKLDVKEYNGEQVRLAIETELTHLDSALAHDEIPGMKTNRIKTQIEGTMGKPLLLSGLLQEDVREKTKGVAGLAEIPILGKLFASEDYQNDRSELVAVLLPYREPPREPMQRISSDIPKGFLPMSKNYLSSDQVSDLKRSRSYPWNAL